MSPPRPPNPTGRAGARRAAAMVLVLALVLAAPFLVKNYRVFQATLVLASALAVLGLNLLTGYNGQLSLGHGAFYAIGAYTAAILVERAAAPWWSTLPAAALLGFGVGGALGYPALRLGGQHLALATFGLALAVPQLLKWKAIEGLTGGVQGIVLTRPEAPFTLHLFGQPLNTDRWLFFVAAGVTTLVVVLARNLVRGRVGRALVAIRDHPVAAAASGIDVARYKTLTFGVSAGCTALAGALGALAVGFVSPDSFTVFLSISLLVGAVVGGLASIGGAFVGALFIQFVPNLADQVSKSAPWAIYGLILIACMIALPDGVAGRVRRWRARRSA